MPGEVLGDILYRLGGRDERVTSSDQEGGKSWSTTAFWKNDIKRKKVGDEYKIIAIKLLPAGG